MPTIKDFKATSTPFAEAHKCEALASTIRETYEPNQARTDALATLQTLKEGWQARYETELAAADIDDLPSSVTTQITALQNTYDNYSG